MKTKKVFLSASRPVVLALACMMTFSFTACSDDEKSIDELLSDKTTPVTFEISTKSHIMFDYAGNNYVGSDTISSSYVYHYKKNRNADGNTELNLRQGKHHLLWFTGIYADVYGWNEDYNRRPTFNPITKTVEALPGNNICYATCDLNVSEYLLPIQKLTFQPLSALIEVEVTDSPDLSIGDGWMELSPLPTSIPIEGKGYAEGTVTSEDREDYALIIRASGGRNKTTSVYYDPNGSDSNYYHILCPTEGIDNMKMTAIVENINGNPIPVVELPKFSIRRGYTTTLRGPLFSGTTSDWTVTMESWNN